MADSAEQKQKRGGKKDAGDGAKRGLSVVVPVVNLITDIVDCLSALEKQRASVDLEVLVVDRLGERVRKQVASLFPWVKVIAVDEDTTIPQMRAIAFREATKEAVAVIEDHVMVPEGWALDMLRALDEGAEVVGGSVENSATETLLDWAAFLCEYSHLIPPIESGKVGSVTGNNVVYKRELLERFQKVAEEGQWENRLHDALREQGIDLVCHPEIVVGHKKHYSFAEYMSQRYLYARSYAGARVEHAALPKRVGYAVGSFALPPVLFYRIVSRIAQKKTYNDKLVKSLPLIGMFVTAWAAGEVVGSIAGAGKSLSKVC